MHRFPILLDAFETVALPRRVTRHFVLRRGFIAAHGSLVADCRPSNRFPSATFLGYFGPLSLIFLLVFWALNLVWVSRSCNMELVGTFIWEMSRLVFGPSYL